MKSEFKIYKKGVTSEPVTIMSKEGEPFNKDQKIKKYESLGYLVTPVTVEDCYSPIYEPSEFETY